MEVLWEAAKSGYVKKYPCKWGCGHFSRQDYIRHIEDKHMDELPEGYTPTHYVFDQINKKDHGNCVICGRETKWDENKARYDRICERPECMNEYRNRTKKNMIRIYGTDNLLKDPQQQQRMLANRKISGQYKWSDGTLKGYTGTYEKKTLEFLDKVMEYKSEDVLTPGPVVPYRYNNEDHFWITDIYIPAYQLCIDVKDGGSNPNNRSMKDYRAKQIAKERAIVEQKQYNYLRLTDNNFGQLMTMLAELKMQLVDNDSSDRVIRVHENMFAGISAMMPMGSWNQDNGDTFIVNYMKKNTFVGTGWTNNIRLKKLIIQDSAGVLHETDERFLIDAEYTVYKVKGSHLDDYKRVLSECGQEKPTDYIVHEIFGEYPLTSDEWICREDVEKVPDFYEYMEACRNIAGASIDPQPGVLQMNESYGPNKVVVTKKDRKGMVYLENSITGMRGIPYKNEEDIPSIERDIIRGGLF